MKKMLLLALLITISALGFAGCGNKADPDESGSGSGSGSTKDKEILTALEQGSMDIEGVYYEISSSTGEVGTLSDGKPFVRHAEFTFSTNFSEIKDVEINENDGHVVVTYTARLLNEFYIVTDPQKIHAVLTRSQDGAVSFVSAKLDENAEPFIQPAHEFDKSFIFDKAQEIQFFVPANEYSEEKHLFPGATAEYMGHFGKDTGGSYVVSLVISKDTVKNINLAPSGSDDKAIQSTPLKMKSAKVVLTLANDLEISTRSEIYYYPKSENKVPSDFWVFRLSDSAFGFRVEK